MTFKRTVTAICLALMSPAAASPYAYVCRDHGKQLLAVFDLDQHTLNFRGKTYGSIKEVEGNCAATFAGDGVKLCIETQGYADIFVAGKDLECRLKK